MRRRGHNDVKGFTEGMGLNEHILEWETAPALATGESNGPDGSGYDERGMSASGWGSMAPFGCFDT